jgi:hypothetical protein
LLSCWCHGVRLLLLLLLLLLLESTKTASNERC